LAQGCGADVLGDPIDAVAWLARVLVRRGGELDPGDLVSTGTLTGLLQVLPGQTFEADFGELGRVSVFLE
jgi:2-keto-4-pentenoate hydratase